MWWARPTHASYMESFRMIKSTFPSRERLLPLHRPLFPLIFPKPLFLSLPCTFIWVSCCLCLLETTTLHSSTHYKFPPLHKFTSILRMNEELQKTVLKCVLTLCFFLDFCFSVFSLSLEWRDGLLTDLWASAMARRMSAVLAWMARGRRGRGVTWQGKDTGSSQTGQNNFHLTHVKYLVILTRKLTYTPLYNIFVYYFLLLTHWL